MKKSNLIMLALMYIGLTFSSCSSDDDMSELEQQEQDRYAEFVTPEMEAALNQLGMPVYRGINPPNIEESIKENVGTAKMLTVISGEVMRSTGREIVGLKIRYAYLMKDDGGIPNLMAEGQGRIIGDDDITMLTKEEFENLSNNARVSQTISSVKSIVSSID